MRNANYTTIAYGALDTLAATSSYLPFQVDLEYSQADDAAWIEIEFGIMNGDGLNVGTYFLVDDLNGDASVAIESVDDIANADFYLEQNYPNPFNPATTFAFSIPSAAPTRLVVYNAAGQVVASVVDNVLAAGRHQIEWDARDLPSGVYHYHLTAGEFSQSKRFHLLK